MSIKQTYDIDELNRVVKFIDAVETASDRFNVRIDALDGIYLVVDGKDTSLFVSSDDGNPYIVSPMVSV